MAHYICKGENCNTIAHQPTVCLEPSCGNRYKLLTECNCSNINRHKSGSDQGGVKGGLNPVNLGLSLGFVIGGCVFILGLSAALSGVGREIVYILSGVYIGYNDTLVGAAAGGLWALIDGFVFGFVIAWIYNKLQNIR